MSSNNKRIFFCFFGEWWVTNRYNWGVIALFNIEGITFSMSDHAEKHLGYLPVGAKKHFIERFNTHTWQCILSEFNKKTRKGMRRKFIQRYKKQQRSIEAFLVRETDLIPF